jgi:hypothetical protein
MTLGLKDGILIIYDKSKTLTTEEIIELVKGYEESTGKVYPYVLTKNVLGYYRGWDISRNCSIYCGTMSEKTSLSQIKEYIKNVQSSNI